ncbi:NLR family CARD domain-containing protein 3-like [Ixodes scapularis]
MAAFLKMQPPTSHEGLPTTACQVEHYFRQHGLDVARPCSAPRNSASTTEVRRCWILDSTAVWNRVLHAVSLELLEDSPGRLTLKTSVLYPPGVKDKSAVGAFLVATLLNDHRCVHHVEIRHMSHLMYNAGNVFDDVVLNEGIGQVTLTDQRPLHSELRNKASKLIMAVLMGDPRVLRFRTTYLSRTLRKTLREVIVCSTRLSELTLHDTRLVVHKIVRILEVVRYSTTITSLTLDKNNVFIKGSRGIADLLESNTSLVELSLRETVIDDEGATAIAGALKINKTLKRLNLASNEIFTDGVRDLSRALKKNTSLRVLDLERNTFGDQGVMYVADMLRVNVTLQELNLSNTKMTDYSLLKLVDSLKVNRTLRVLSVRHNVSRGRAMRELTYLLGINNTLTRLNCPSTYFVMTLTDFGDYMNSIRRSQAIDGLEIVVDNSAQTRKLSRMIKVGRTLRHLSVIRGDHCTLSPLLRALKENESVESLEIDFLFGGEIRALGSLLQETTTIRSVTLKYPVNMAGFISLMNGLAHNNSLWKFSLDCTMLKEGHCTEIARMLVSNETLNDLALRDAPAVEAGLPILAGALSMNQTLQQFAITYPTSNAAGLHVVECLRRNCSRMARAVEFVLAQVASKKSAEAFEAFRHNEFFVQRLAESAGGRQRAETLLREADHRILKNYFVITEVVKGALVCLRFPGSEHSMEIDSLDEYSLIEITSYLKISDVK